MLKKLPAVIATIVACAFIIVSIAHACSGLTPVILAVQQSPMTGDMGDGPCGAPKPDICGSVRDSLLLVKPSITAADHPQQAAPPLELSAESLTQIVSPPAASVDGVSFHPVFKLRLTVSYQVLRI